MNKSIFAIQLLFGIASAHAMTNGVELNSPEYVGVSGGGTTCSGSVIAGKWVVTAAHCGDMTGGSVRNMQNTVVTIKRVIHHPDYDATFPRYFDVALFELNSVMPVSAQINAIAPPVGDIQSIAGYSAYHGGVLKGSTAVASGHADPRFSPDGYELIYDSNTSQPGGVSTPGDSGGPCYNAAGVWGVIQGSAGQGDGTYIQSCQGFFHTKTTPWLLETINGWSYPTVVQGEGSLMIKVQSLHQSGEVFTPFVEGALSIESNSCALDSTVMPLGLCIIVVKGTGKLHISNEDVIEVNKQVIPEPSRPDENGSDSGGGGSTGPVVLITLGLAALVRRFPLN